ncbi:MAG TPA: hypothetical protein VLX90_00135 [Steroidobacteraceae bacterium]|nr:hypothetical protein [Steroidobacteraceae bacterium]
MTAIGLELRDLFDHPNGRPARPAPRMGFRELWDLIDHEVMVVGMIAAEFRDKRMLSQESWQRLSSAVGRIGRIRDHANGCR